MNANLNLLQKLVSADHDAVRSAFTRSSVDLRSFLAFARRHRVGTYCYWRMRDLGLAAALPGPFRVAAKANALLDREQNERLLAQMHSITERLNKTGASALFIKGPLFAQRYYGSLEARSVADLDILVKQSSDLEKVEQVLLSEGYRRISHVPLSRRLSRVFAHHHEYRREDVPIDVHWALQRHFSLAVDYERLWDQATFVHLDGLPVRTASDEYEIVLQILGVLTDLQVGKLRLRSMVDIVYALRTVDGKIDWQSFLAVRAREHLLRPTAFALHLALESLGCNKDFPDLNAALSPTIGTLPSTEHAHAAVLRSKPLDLRQKLLALRVYETPLASAIAWWALSLPFRMLVYGARQR